MKKTSRIVVTGMGVISPLGNDLTTFHQSLRAGRSGISKIETRFDAGYKTNRAGVVHDFNISQFVNRSLPRGFGRTTCLALAASQMAIHHAGLDGFADCGIVTGTAMGEALEREAVYQTCCENNVAARRGEADFENNAIPAKVAAILGLAGPAHLIASTCASGNHAIDWACDLLRDGHVTAMLAVGVDTIGYVDLLGFNRLFLQAPDACRPFDLHRKGMILSEGAGALLLERLDSAQARSALILAEVAGCGISCDADPAFNSRVSDVDALLVAAENALREAGMDAGAIQYVNSHGSGTKLNDARETHFVKSLLGEHATDVTMSSVKSMLGHAQGAASSLEAIACVLTFQHNVLYPTINYQTPDPQCDLDCIPNEARECEVDVILSNAFGVGGNNALVIMKRWKGA